MKFKKLLAKINEQSGSGQAINVLYNIKQLRNTNKTGRPNVPPYIAKANK